MHLGLGDDLAERVTREPRRYGLHATLKAPFRLRSDIGLPQLAQALAELATQTQPLSTEPLRLQRLGSFLALCPQAIDQRRLGYIETLMRQSGLSAEVARARAQILYWAFLGLALSDKPLPPARRAMVLEELLRIASR